MTLFRNCCFTLNNYSEEEFNFLLNHESFKYIIIGKEISESKTPHLQGYFELIKQTRLNTLKKINDRMHIESRKGSQKQAIDYCKKDGDFYEKGTLKIQGKRSDLDKLKADLVSGRSIRDIVQNESISYQGLKFLQSAEPYLLKNKLVNKKVIWCYGPTGTGKSKFAWDYIEDKDDIYYKSPDDKWWDGYDGQKVVVIDDMRGNHFEFSKLLRMFDIYPYRVEYKGGSRLLTSETIIVTSNRHPSDIYRNVGESINQLLRRIEIKEFCAPVSQVVVSEVAGNTGVFSPPARGSGW
jgi:hypothetical protein